MHNSYSSLGKDFKSIFEDLVRHMTAQRSEADTLRRQLQSATSAAVLQNASLATRVQDALDEERRQAAEDRQKLMAQIASLLNAQVESQEARMSERASQMQKTMADSSLSLEGAVAHYGQGMETWDEKEGRLLDDVRKSRDQLKLKLKDDWTAASEQSTTIQNTAKSVHAETARLVDERAEDLDAQMEALDDFVGRARSENASHHETHSQSVQALSNTVEQSFGNISAHFKATFDRVKNLGEDMELDAADMQDGLGPLDMHVCQPLANLREAVTSTSLHEYQPTGETPQKTLYTYPTKLPRTKPRGTLMSRINEASPLRDDDGHDDDDDGTELEDSILAPPEVRKMASPRSRARRPSHAASPEANQLSMSLREVSANVGAASMASLTVAGLCFDGRAGAASVPADMAVPIVKRTRASLKKQGAGAALGVAQGRENLPPTADAFSQSSSRRKSPRHK